MAFLFGKKQTVQAWAEVLEDGREKMNTEMKKPKFNNYSGPEIFLELAVRVQPQNDPPRVRVSGILGRQPLAVRAQLRHLGLRVLPLCLQALLAAPECPGAALPLGEGTRLCFRVDNRILRFKRSGDRRFRLCLGLA